jgi:DNA polymerase III epsilon subunit-like protein
MKILVFDTETTGLPKSKFISPSTLNLWPYIVQFSYIVYDISSNEIIETKDYIIKVPENISISNDSSKIHGITNDISNKKGLLINNVFIEFFKNLKNVDTLVGHNIQFDINMIKIELLRIINSELYTANHIKLYKEYFHYISNYENIKCTLKDSTIFCNIQSLDKSGKTFLKYPKLYELHEKLFDKIPKNLHNSFNDVLVTLRCFMKLQYGIDVLDNCESYKNYSYNVNLV